MKYLQLNNFSLEFTLFVVYCWESAFVDLKLARNINHPITLVAFFYFNLCGVL